MTTLAMLFATGTVQACLVAATVLIVERRAERREINRQMWTRVREIRQ